MEKFPNINCEGDCAFESRGWGWECQECKKYLHPGDKYFNEVEAYYKEEDAYSKKDDEVDFEVSSFFGDHMVTSIFEWVNFENGDSKIEHARLVRDRIKELICKYGL